MPRALGESAQCGAGAGLGPPSSSAAGRADAEQGAASIAGGAPGGGGGSTGGWGSLQKRRVHVAVKYDRLELQLSLEVEKWIDGCLEELYSAGRQTMRATF